MYTKTNTITIGATATVDALCDDDNDILLHGGCETRSLADSFPLGPHVKQVRMGWRCRGGSGITGDYVRVWATCLSVP